MIASPRDDYLDRLRAVLMLLGIVSHSSDVFETKANWLIRSPHPSQAFDVLGAVIIQFRMPAFFLIAGYYCHVGLRRHSTAAFLRSRAERLLVPLVVTGLTLNSVQTLIAEAHAGRGRGALDRLLSVTYWTRGQWVAHLWFLIFLAFYTLLAAGAHGVVRRLSRPIVQPRWRPTWEELLGGGRYLLVMPLVTVAADILGRVIARPAAAVFPLVDASELVELAPYFAFGILAAARPALLAAFLKFRRWPLPLAALAAAAAFTHAVRPDRGHAELALYLYGSAFLSWALAAACFQAFHRWGSRPSARFAYLANASYTIYLVHHLAVVALAAWIVTWPLGVGAQFLVLVGAVTLVSVGFHHLLVLRVPALQYLLNGRRPATSSSAA